MSSIDNVFIAIDPGFDRVGVAVLKKESNKDILLYSECLITDRRSSSEDRLLNIYNKVEKIIKDYKPNILAIESIFFFKNQKTIIGVAEGRGVILLLGAKYNMKVIELTPMQIKLSVCGDGHADKKQVDYMVRKLIKLEDNSENKEIKLDDEIDAIACGLTALAFYKNF